MTPGWDEKKAKDHQAPQQLPAGREEGPIVNRQNSIHVNISLQQGTNHVLSRHPELFKILADMTTIAITPKLATMDIVFSVTVPTALAELNLVRDRFLMTGNTFQRRMCPLKLEFGSGIMIEQPKIPAVWIVASGAILPQSLFMLIILTVTTDTDP